MDMTVMVVMVIGGRGGVVLQIVTVPQLVMEWVASVNICVCVGDGGRNWGYRIRLYYTKGVREVIKTVAYPVLVNRFRIQI